MKEVEYLLSAKAVRERAKKILELSLKGDGEFTVHMDRLDDVAEFVVGVIKEKYPDLKIPYHTRFNHFTIGGKDRIQELNTRIKACDEIERARIKIDLVVTSVLLDAGAGETWKYKEGSHVYARSEGLAVASFNMFMNGSFSSDKSLPYRADGPGLLQITEEAIKKGFQVTVSNPLLGTKGRAELLQKLGEVVESEKEFFGGTTNRPGNLVDYFLKIAPNKKLEAEDLLLAVLKGMGKIWPGRVIMNDINLGDTWRYPKLGNGWEGFVPFHKLSQWMSYSLLDPLEELGFKILNLPKLTGLAEYRNGGLMIDTGLIEPKFDKQGQAFHPDSKVIIEWRALTVALLDEIAKVVQKKLKLTADEFPLAKVLEGGTWWAGRKLAQEKRAGKAPLEIISDGTVF